MHPASLPAGAEDLVSQSNVNRVLRLSSSYVHVAIRGRPGVLRSSTVELPLPQLPIAFEVLLRSLPLTLSEAINKALAVGPQALETLQALAAAGVIEDGGVDDVGRG